LFKSHRSNQAGNVYLNSDPLFSCAAPFSLGFVSFCRLPPNPPAWLALLASDNVARPPGAAEAQEKENQNPAGRRGQRGGHWAQRGRVVRRGGAGEPTTRLHANNSAIEINTFPFSILLFPPCSPCSPCPSRCNPSAIQELPHHRIIRNIRRFFAEVGDNQELRSNTIENMLMALPSASKAKWGAVFPAYRTGLTPQP